jgi:starch phosphorylase
MVRAAWPAVRVEHVEATGLGDVPQLGEELTVRAFVALGTLMPDDVEVEVVHGRVDANDRIVEGRTSILNPLEQYEGNRWRCETTVPLAQAGAFGYTVRVRPRNAAMASTSELGLGLSRPSRPGMFEGDLR